MPTEVVAENPSSTRARGFKAGEPGKALRGGHGAGVFSEI
jgi:hypothetical protein